MNKLLWIIWIFGTIMAAASLAAYMYVGGSRSHMLIGDTTSAHHQIEMACESCHTSPIFANAENVQKDMNKACLSCHAEELNLSNDSHPVKKFKSVSAIEQREELDALYCSTCHSEHLPEITNVGAVSLPLDLCAACHQEVGENRPSHVEFVEQGFDTCASAGCHNFHDNSALYEDFLVKHAGKPEMLEVQLNPHAALARGPNKIEMALATADPVATLSKYLEDNNFDRGNAYGPDDDGLGGVDKDAQFIQHAARLLESRLSASDALAPQKYMDEASIAEWAGSDHALAGINCSGCHAPGLSAEDQKDVSALETAWIEAPAMEVCAACHNDQATTFTMGKHGMRAHPNLSKPRTAEGAVASILNKTPLGDVFTDEALSSMTVAHARIPMKDSAHDFEIGNCNSCHLPHAVNTQEAAVEACLGCHDDEHTLAYEDSLHHQLWLTEMSGDGPPGSGVSCADCHMPKIQNASGDFFTTHNQNAYLRPNEKMIRPVCMSCHSLEFSIDALADPELVQSNFQGRPSKHIESIDMSLSRIDKTP